MRAIPNFFRHAMAYIVMFRAALILSTHALLVHASSSWLGDGWCDAVFNTREYKFDDGDCCESTCTARLRTFPCGANGYNCRIVEPIPSWFNQTQLCYKWRPDGDGGQCGGGVGRELCAVVGSSTTYYRDDTDGRGGGCRMQWGIRSPYSPAWFQSVKICYRWYADGNSGQCGGGAATELCATVGHFTSEYRDDTDGRGGGCRMSWRLQIPSNSPQWLRNVNLCYNWYPDGNSGQCGGGVGRSLCARANLWTTYYRDDTDGRGGGCRMSWQLRF